MEVSGGTDAEEKYAVADAEMYEIEPRTVSVIVI